MKNPIRYFVSNLSITKKSVMSNGVVLPDKFPCIETKRLILRKLTYADAPALFGYFSQDIVTEYYDLPTLRSLEEAESLIRIWNVDYEAKKIIRWAIVLKENNQVIGTCGYHNFYNDHYRAEIGYELNPQFWRQGYMTEAVTAIQGYGFKKLKLHRIEAFIFPDNLASRMLLNKVGLRSEGILRGYFREKGKFVDGEIFSILLHEWKKRSNNIRYSTAGKLRK